MIADGIQQQSANSSNTSTLSTADSSLLAGAASAMYGADQHAPGDPLTPRPNALQALLSQDNVTEAAGPGGGGSHYTVADYWVSADGKTFTIQAADAGGNTQNIDFNPPNSDYTFGQNGRSVYYIGSTGNIIHDSPFSPQDLQNLVDAHFSSSASATQPDAQAAITGQDSAQLFNSGIQYSAYSDISAVANLQPSNTWMDSEGRIYTLGEGPEGSTISIPTVAKAYDYTDRQRDYNNQSLRNIVQGANQGFVSSILVNHEIMNGGSLEAQERALAAGGPVDELYAAAAVVPGGHGSIEPATFDRYEPIGPGPTVARQVGPQLLPTEGNVGTYRDLIKAGSKGDNVTPNHIPSANRMALEGISQGDGIAINMEQPVPGVGGRHRATFTYGTQADIGLSARDALAAGIWDTRQIYRADGLYTPQIRSSLQDVIRLNKTTYPSIFLKEDQ